MKKLILLLICFSALFPLRAQQALNERPNVTSPVILEDKSARFSIYAPNAKDVQVSGDFEGSPLKLTRDSIGVWSGTTGSLSPELYIYQFIIDGSKTPDPSNVYTKRDISTIYSMLFIPGDDSSLYSVQNVPHGTVSRLWYDSPTLGTQRRISVYTPAGYEKSDEEYPVLYLLHGMGGDEEAWLTLGRTAQIMDNLIAQGLATPMIVVMPNGNADLESAPGESPSGFVVPTTALPHTMDGTFEKSFPDIINFIDSTYRTRNSKSGRAVAGLSMGGFHSLNISALYPDKFDYIGLFSSAISPRKGSDSPLFVERDELIGNLFAGKPELYWIGIGKDDFLYNDNVEYRKKLDSKGYKYTYHESDGGHTWKNWRKYLSQFAPMLFKRDISK